MSTMTPAACVWASPSRMRLGCRCAHTRAPSHPRNSARTARLLTVAALQADIFSRSSQAVALQYLPRAVARIYGCRQISPGQPSSLSGTDQLVQRQAAHMLCDEQLHVYRSDLTTGMLAPAAPLLFRCCTTLPLLLKDVGGSSARADGQPAQPGAAAASRCLGGWRRSRLRQRTI